MAGSKPSLRVLFLEALDLEDPAERAAYLDRACGGDVALRRKLEELIAADAEAQDVLTAGCGADEPSAASADLVNQPGDRIDRGTESGRQGEGRT